MKELKEYLFKTSKLIEKNNKTKRDMRHKQKEIYQQLAEAKDEINQAEKARDFIIARVSRKR